MVQPNGLPSTWSPMASKETWKAVRLTKGSKEYENILKTFQATVTNRTIEVTSIVRIQNPKLWSNHQKFKSEAVKKSKEKNKSILERYLFHGAKYSEIDSICEKSLSEKISTERSCKSFGKGFYFTSEAEFVYGHADDDEKVAFVCSVTIGKMATKNRTKVDTIVDCESHPITFFKSKKESFYPEYLITYKKLPAIVQSSSVQLICNRVSDVVQDSDNDVTKIFQKIMSSGSTEDQMKQMVTIILSLQNQMNSMDASKRQDVDLIGQNIILLIQTVIGSQDLVNRIQRVIELYNTIIIEYNKNRHTIETIREFVTQLYSYDDTLKDIAGIAYNKFAEFIQDLPESGFVFKLQKLGGIVTNMLMQGASNNQKRFSHLKLEDVFPPLAIGPAASSQNDADSQAVQKSVVRKN